MKPIDNKINFFDLDGVLWDTDSRVWVIDKEDPSKPIIRLDRSELNNVLSGIYFKQDLKVEYNGDEYYLSQEIFNKINRKKRIAIERLGLSWIEYYDEKYINNTKTKFLLDNISHLRNKEEFVCILTGRAHQKRHSDLLNTLRKKLVNIGISIYKIYFVSNKLYYKHNVEISLNKAHILLEHMIGIKIEDGKFVSKKQDWYKEIHFYYDEVMNIDYANDIQVIFDRVMKKTDDEMFLRVIERIKNNEITLVTNLVTNNTINRFVTNKVILSEPVKYPIK